MREKNHFKCEYFYIKPCSAKKIIIYNWHHSFWFLCKMTSWIRIWLPFSPITHRFLGTPPPLIITFRFMASCPPLSSINQATALSWFFRKIINLSFQRVNLPDYWNIEFPKNFGVWLKIWKPCDSDIGQISYVGVMNIGQMI